MGLILSIYLQLLFGYDRFNGTIGYLENIRPAFRIFNEFASRNMHNPGSNLF